MKEKISPIKIYPRRSPALAPNLPRTLSFASRQLLRDLLILLNFDLNVLHCQQQPGQITYRDSQGRKRTYTPELLITYRTDIIPAKWMPPLLCEVRCREDLFQNWAELKPKLRAARAFARKRKWQFQVLTEPEIRTPYLYNAQFLLPYRRLEINWEHADLLMDTLHELRVADPQTLLIACSESQTHRLELLSSLWHLVSRKWIGADLTEHLTMRHVLWANEC
jgi:hypothetical protein